MFYLHTLGLKYILLGLFAMCLDESALLEMIYIFSFGENSDRNLVRAYWLEQY